MEKEERINNSQFYGIITNEDLGWQSMIYDLIKTEQLDPWDIDIVKLAEKYLDVIKDLEDANFFISSKVLLACSLLLKLKSEILANSFIQDLNEALYGRGESQKVLEIDKYIVDENELPLLIPRSPMARNKKVTLDQLMSALNKAISTENRRIKRTIRGHQAKKMTELVFPKNKFIPLKIRIKKIFNVINNHFSTKTNAPLEFNKLANEREEKLASFLPILHLSEERKINLYQPLHFKEIFITKDRHPEEQKLIEAELEMYNN